MKPILLTLIALLFLATAEGRLLGQGVEQHSVLIKIDVKIDTTRSKTIYVGDRPWIKIGLLDASNNSTSAKKDFIINVQIKSEKGDVVDQKDVTIKAGTNTISFQASPTKQSGLLEIQARHAELHDGGTFFYVKPKPAPAKKPATVKKKAFANHAVSSEPTEVVPQFVKAAFQTPAEGDSPGVRLKISPDRKMLANGLDPAEISVILSEPAPKTVVIRLRVTEGSGKLEPATLTVPEGEVWPGPNAGAKLTSTQYGKVSVGLDGSEPNIGLHVEKDLEIEFEAPIADVGFQAAPQSIYSIDDADVVVRLYDANNKPVNTDVERTISLDLQSSNGSLKDNTITIKPGSFEGRTKFFPAGRGDVNIQAFLANFESKNLTIHVNSPILFLFLSVVGGLIGGVIAYKREESKWRIASGAVTGFVLFWACLFGLIPGIPRLIARNEISAVALPILGGWLGTELFTLILKRVGIIS